jgi:Na+/phosphate symporter
MKDKYVQSVKDKFEQRSQTGIKKYNTTLEREDLSLEEWLNHAQEEAMDLALYLERIKSEIREKIIIVKGIE